MSAQSRFRCVKRQLPNITNKTMVFIEIVGEGTSPGQPAAASKEAKTGIYWQLVVWFKAGVSMGGEVWLALDKDHDVMV